MKTIKFACPGCQQRIECDASHAGREVTCPACKAALRIPKATTALPGQVPKAELAAARQKEKAGETPVPGKKKTSSIPPVRIAKTPAPAATGSQKPAREPDPKVIHCLCPVCKSELRVSGSPTAVTDRPQEALLVRRGVAPVSVPGETAGQGKVKAAGKQPEEGAMDKATSAAQAARSGGELKPRMSYVLTGKPPAPKTPKKSADHGQEEESGDEKS